MKRILLIMMTVFIVLTVAGCKGTEPTDARVEGQNAIAIAVDEENEVFTITPQEFIDALNSVAENSGENVPQISDFEKSRDEIKISGNGLTLTLVTSSKSSQMHGADLYWYSGDNNLTKIRSALFYAGAMLGLLDPDHAQAIGNDIQKISEMGHGSTFSKENGIVIDYELTSTGANKLRISASSD